MPFVQSRTQSLEEYLDDANVFLTKQIDLAEQKEADDEDVLPTNGSSHEISFFNSGRAKGQEYSFFEPIQLLPDRIEALYQRGTFKIALKKKQETTPKGNQHGRNKVADANERQLALYQQGVAKIRQQRMCTYNSKQENHPTDLTDVRTKTVISDRISRRQRSLYVLGVRKQRAKNRQGIAILNSQQEVLIPKGDGNYYRRLYHLLHNLVAKIERPLPLGETLSTEIEESSSSRSETALNVVKNGIADIISTLKRDLPEIRGLQKSPTSLTTLKKEKKLAMNLSKLSNMSNNMSQQSSTKTAILQCQKSLRVTSSYQQNDADIDMNALELGLRGIVVQYLLDAVKESQRSKRLEKYSDVVSLEDCDVETVESSNRLVFDLVSEESWHEDSMSNSHATSQTLTATESFSGNRQLSADLVSSSGKSCQWGLVFSERSCLGWSGSDQTSDGLEMLLEHDDSNQSRESIPFDYKGTEFVGRNGNNAEASNLENNAARRSTESTSKLGKKKLMASRRVIIRKTTNDVGEIELCIM
jgi:hypothetical protein